MSSCEYAGEHAQATRRASSPMFQSLWRARRDHGAVAGANVALLTVDPQAPDAARHEVELLGHPVEVLRGRGAGRQRGLGQTLVDSRRGGRTGPLADLRAVLGRERLDLVVARDI